MSTDDTATESDALESAADATVKRSLRWYAGVYLSVLFGGAAVAIALAVHAGILVPEITVTATVAVGWLVEYVAIALAALFIVWTVAMMLIILPGQLVGGLVSAVARIADSYELPSDTDR